MLRARIVVAAVLVATLVPGTAAQRKRSVARPKAAMSVQQTIADLEQEWLDALVRRDPAKVGTILAPDFHDTTMTGQVRDRQQALAAVTDNTFPDFQRSIERLDVQAYDGRFAVAHGVLIVSGKGVRLARVAFTDVFVLHDGQWQAVSAQENLIQRQ